MALERAMIYSAIPNSFLRIPRNPLSNTQFHVLSLTRFFRPNIVHLPYKRSLRCSADFNDQNYDRGAGCAKPAEIPWSKELCNSVHLIGIVGNPVEIRRLASGKVLAWTRLAVKKSATDTISLTFWEELAEVAFQHVEKGNQIYISGRLTSDTVESDDGKLQTYYKVVVQQLNFIEKSLSSTPSYDRGSTAVRKSGNNTINDAGSIQELWQAFFANPLEWWDNRKNKKNPKYPDFKHKDTGEALWVEGRYNPPWVKSQLAILDEKMQSFGDQESGMHVTAMTGDDLALY
ncbi:hypothetical protein K2173_025727 [Erythroxylum novogranatense]|uniref:Uncharacterized protein n=1 Tax=Erythroxylum novogranatense TaxID=1862640 RepID=A0AAV8SBE7_9ROSI|nr:hypothetical protein K2173_025727 [Erythroxylum novogranatense]